MEKHEAASDVMDVWVVNATTGFVVVVVVFLVFLGFFARIMISLMWCSIKDG